MKKNDFKRNIFKICIFLIIFILSIISMIICSQILKELNTTFAALQPKNGFWKSKFLNDAYIAETITQRILYIPDYINGLKNDLPEKSELTLKTLDEINKVINRDLINSPVDNAKHLIGIFERTRSNYNALLGTIIGLSSLLFITSAGFIVNSSIELMYLKATPKAQQ
ncbi:hypothetical protein [Mycoplasmopsis bovis]|uniref:hypothetical protein n=2 Tax=Mycoplasmopsis bovis TaxID=28903 RepID=UPI001CF4AFC1|nr:hypothetical protein [Mycoplasmopsis bovis]MCA8839666.1 hypothetical protein [Mycoplasmopsis bovis]MCA8843570.1 hypothetical protein [Mycoplasmopsis bovis]